MAKQPDPTETIRKKASQYPGVNQGSACTQSSFKIGKKSFLFIGEQGGRYKAMFKLGKSLPQAEKLKSKEPDNYQVGSSAWVTVRFTAEKPIPKSIWTKWLDESYELSRGTGGPKTAKKKSSKKKVSKQAGKKKVTRKKAKSVKAKARKKQTSKKTKATRKKTA